MSEQLKMSDTNWIEMSNGLKMNEWKLLGMPSMNTVERYFIVANVCVCEKSIMLVTIQDSDN